MFIIQACLISDFLKALNINLLTERDNDESPDGSVAAESPQITEWPLHDPAEMRTGNGMGPLVIPGRLHSRIVHVSCMQLIRILPPGKPNGALIVDLLISIKQVYIPVYVV